MNKLTTTLATVGAALLLVTQLLLSIDDLLLRVNQAPGQRTDGLETCRPAGPPFRRLPPTPDYCFVAWPAVIELAAGPQPSVMRSHRGSKVVAT